MSLGKKIKALRIKKSIKQIELARTSGISNTYLSDIENERVTPSLKTLTSISNALGIDCSTLLSKNYVNNEK